LKVPTPGMRLVSFVAPSSPDFHIGAHVLPENIVFDFTLSLPGCPATMRGFLEGGDALLSAAVATIASPDATRYPFSDVVLKVLPEGKINIVASSFTPFSIAPSR
jgi:hypothetical protein